MAHGGSGTSLIRPGTDPVAIGGPGEVTLYGGADREVRVAGGSLVVGGGHVTLAGGYANGAVTLLGGNRRDANTPEAKPPTFMFGTGHDSVVVGGQGGMIHVVGGLGLIGGFHIGVDKLHSVVAASHVPASAAPRRRPADAYGDNLMYLADGTRIDMVGIDQVTPGGVVT